MSAPPEIGSAANRYEILAKLAEGGMAEIFLARGRAEGGIERYVVLKRILRERAHDVELVRMFLEEARLAAQLQHPNVAQVYDVGRLGESYFFTMEYVHGETVRAIAKRSRALGTPVPIPAVLAVAAGAAAGLHHAHERKGPGGRPLGIVHRDVSPSNLMVSYEGHVKVVDFGVAKAADRVTTTHSGTVKGKIAYLSPEQCESRPIDRRSDLFALGIVLWELLTDEYLYRRDSDFLTMTAIVEEPPPRPSSRRRDVPAALDEIVQHLLAKDPAARFQSAGALVEAIESVAARSGAPMTPSALARFMRSWFGERAEPWVEMTGSPSILTVKSDPIPDELTAVTSSVDEELRRVPTLPPMEVDLEELKRTLVLGAPPPQVPHAPQLRQTAPTVPDRPARPAQPAAPEPPHRHSRTWLVIASVAVVAASAILALAQPWRHAASSVAPAPAADPWAQPAPPAASDPAPDPSAKPVSPVVVPHVVVAPPAADAGAGPSDASTPARAVHHPTRRHVVRAHPADAGVDPCAADPMACQK